MTDRPIGQATYRAPDVDGLFGCFVCSSDARRSLISDKQQLYGSKVIDGVDSMVLKILIYVAIMVSSAALMLSRYRIATPLSIGHILMCLAFMVIFALSIYLMSEASQYVRWIKIKKPKL